MDSPWPLASSFVACIVALVLLVRAMPRTLRLPGGAEIPGRPVLLRVVASRLSRARAKLRHRGALLIVGTTLVSALTVASPVFLLLAVVPTAAAIDPGHATGYLEIDGERIELREAFAHLHRNPDGRLPFTPELRVVLADREVPQASLGGLEALPILDLARAGEVLGLLVRLDPDVPGVALVTLLLPPPRGDDVLVTRCHAGPGDPVVRGLKLSATRVGGQVECPADDDLKCSVRFSAPVFNEQ